MATVEELQAELAKRDESIKALERKNAEILEEKKAAAKKADDLETRLGALEKVAKDAKDAAEAEAAKKAGDWDKREAQLKAAHAEEMKKLQGDLEKANAATQKLVIENGLTAALDEAGVKPEFKPAVLAMLKTRGSKVEIDANGDFVGKLGDKPLADAVKEWAGSDEGKHFVALESTGTGAPGQNKPGVKTGANPYIKGEGYNLTEQGRLEKHDRAKANKLRAEAGLKPL